MTVLDPVTPMRFPLTGIAFFVRPVRVGMAGSSPAMTRLERPTPIAIRAPGHDVIRALGYDVITAPGHDGLESQCYRCPV